MTNIEVFNEETRVAKEIINKVQRWTGLCSENIDKNHFHVEFAGAAYGYYGSSSCYYTKPSDLSEHELSIISYALHSDNVLKAILQAVKDETTRRINHAAVQARQEAESVMKVLKKETD